MIHLFNRIIYRWFKLLLKLLFLMKYNEWISAPNLNNNKYDNKPIEINLINNK